MARKTHKSSEEARESILQAAEDIVVEVGPAGLRISAVAKKANMAHPNIIHHFGSRQGLLNALAERVGHRATDRITQALMEAVQADDNSRHAAMKKVLDMAYPGDEGKAAVWLHLSGAESSIKPHMQKIAEVSHQLRKSISDDVELKNTNRLVMLVTLALIGEVVSGDALKEAFEENDQEDGFRDWLAQLLLNIADQEIAN